MIRTQKAEILERITQFVSAPEPGQLSPLAELSEIIASRFANQIVSQLKAQLYASRSHEAKQEGLLQQDIMLDAATQQSPILGLLAGAFPSVTKRIAKNPTALPALVSLLQKMGAGGQLPLFGPTQPGSNGSGAPGSVADKIRKQG